MRRILFFLLSALFVAGGGIAWIMISDTPEKTLHDGLSHMIALKGAQVVRLDVSWMDSKARSTTGFTYTGALDLRNFVKPNISGLLRVGAGKNGPEDQTGDLIVLDEQVALRPRSVGPAWRSAYTTLVGVTTTKPYVRFERTILLGALGKENAITEAKPEDVRSAVAFITPLALPVGGSKGAQSSLGPLSMVNFKLDRKALIPFFQSLLKTWYVRDPTAEELALVDRLVQSMGAGTYSMAITSKERIPVRLTGDFPYIDADGRSTPITVHFEFGLQGANDVPHIVLPADAVDASIGMQGASASISLPSAKAVTGAGSGLDAIGARPSFGEIVGGTQIDLYAKYADQLKKSRVVPVKKK